MLQPRSHLLAWLLEQAPFGVAWTDGSGVVEVNAQGACILGLNERRLESSAWAGMVRLVDAAGCIVEEARRPLSIALCGQRVPRTRMQVVRPDGTRLHVDVEASPFGGGEGAVAMFEDVSWTLDAERRQVEWVAALGHELGGGLHGLSTAVTGASLLSVRDVDRARHHLQIAGREIRLMVRLVHDFLDAARLGVGALEVKAEPVDLPSVLYEAAEAAEAADPRHRVVVKVPSTLRARADTDRLKQILSNLLSNSAKYSNPGQLILTAQPDGERVLVWLRDEGPGIAADEQSRLFERFHRLPSKREGSGMGLWIARELALRMGGDLWVRSGAGRPTTFCVALPAEVTMALPAEQPAALG
jgi:signal transduction histidine kinase